MDSLVNSIKYLRQKDYQFYSLVQKAEGEEQLSDSFLKPVFLGYKSQRQNRNKSHRRMSLINKYVCIYMEKILTKMSAS